MIYIELHTPEYQLKQKKYNIEYKLGPFNVFSKETGTSEHCERYYSSRKRKNETSGGIVLEPTDFVEHVHDCKDIKYYLTFKPTLLNIPIEFDYVLSFIDKRTLEQRLKLERELGDSGIDFSDNIEEIGYILKAEEVTCSHTHKTLDDYKSSVNTLNIVSFFIVLGSIFLAIFIYKKYIGYLDKGCDN